ncbi:hypothetical protein JXB31_00080 [Candidatus Woesearchaeota archaeon]|nr:hypothetical protein [Candidatus Woesearchaeota archaeon]
MQTSKQKIMPEYVKYLCRRCKYRFRIKQGTKMALRCPNCGGNDIGKDEFDINKVINESENPMYDF